MRFFRKVVLGLVLLAPLTFVSFTAAQAQTLNQDERIDGDTAYDIASTFVQCSGVYEAYSMYARRFYQHALANRMHGLSLDAMTAAAMSASTVAPSDKAWAFARDKRGPVVSYWWNTLRQTGVWNTDFRRELLRCQSLSEWQTQLVREANKQKYGFK